MNRVRTTALGAAVVAAAAVGAMITSTAAAEDHGTTDGPATGPEVLVSDGEVTDQPVDRAGQPIGPSRLVEDAGAIDEPSVVDPATGVDR